MLRCAPGVPEVEDSVRHVCDVCWTLFPPLSPEQLTGNKDRMCGVRGCARTWSRLGSWDQVVSMRRVWYFGERETLADLLAKDGIHAAMLSHVHRKETCNNPDGYWASLLCLHPESGAMKPRQFDPPCVVVPLVHPQRPSVIGRMKVSPSPTHMQVGRVQSLHHSRRPLLPHRIESPC